MLKVIFDHILELIELLFCLHCWHEKQFRTDVWTAAIICVDALGIGLIDTYNIPRWSMVLIYFSLALYCFGTFDVSVKSQIFHFEMALISLFIFQLLSLFPALLFHICTKKRIPTSIILNLFVLVALFMFEKWIGFARMKPCIIQREWLTGLLITICSTAIIYNLVEPGFFSDISGVGYLCLAVLCNVMCIAWYGWIMEKEKLYEKEQDLLAYKLYYESFQRLLQHIRANQHEFQNHLQALSSFQYVGESNNYRSYYQEIVESNRMSGLLSCGNTILAGFLYGKMLQAEAQGIRVNYEIVVNKNTFPVPQYVLIETAGILWDNAVEAVLDKGKKEITIKIMETDSDLIIEVMNEIEKISVSEFMKFFEEGKSTKGPGRGIGLAKINQYGKKYHWDIKVDLFDESAKSYLKIRVCLKKQVKSLGFMKFSERKT